MKLWRRIAGTTRSIRAKLLVCFLVVTVIPLLSLGAMSYYQSAKVINSQFGKYGENAVAQLEQQTNAYLSRMNQTTESIFTYLLDPARVGLEGDEPATYKEIMDKNNLEDFLRALKTEHTASIYIITRSGYYYGENGLDVAKLDRIPGWRQSLDKRDRTWLGFYKPDHQMEGADTGAAAAEPVLGLAVPVSNPYGALKGSLILIEENAGDLLHMFRQFELDTKAHLRLTDAEGKIVYETAEPFANRSTDVVWDKSLTANDWKVEARLPQKAFYHSSGLIRSNTLVVAAASCLLAFGFAYLFSSRFTRRIRRLKDSMQKVSFGKLQTRAKVDANDELGVLDTSFNNMVRGIQTLVREVERTERKKKEAELKAFHYQINPHLLFNTLNSIQWKARLAGAEDIREMLYHLTMVLEGNLDISQELIPLGRELEIIGHFLKIQEIRYGAVFTFELVCDPGIERYLIPRMTLQPLFENIFFHGFEDGEGHIRLSVREEGELLALTLQDDGAGIPPDKLAKLAAKDAPPPKRRGRGGLGVRNADQKFRLQFGPQYGLGIESVAGEGTTITIRWPKREEHTHAGSNAD